MFSSPALEYPEHRSAEVTVPDTAPVPLAPTSVAPTLSPASVLRAEGLRFRAFDLAFVIAALPIVAVVLAIVALLVKLADPRAPVFFVQVRYGRGGLPFRMYKVRTMRPGAELVRAELQAHSQDKGAGFKLDQDPRVTWPGRFLRKSYLDELPQIWNVLRGEMSIVGPRANSADPAGLAPWQRQRLAVRPGITGSWQTMREKPRDFEERCRIDIDYIARKSLRGDVMILLRTLHVMLIRPTGL